jgi:sulfur carrier protein ThiS
MSISVRLIGPMRKPQGQAEVDLPCEGRMTVAEALRRTGYRADELRFFSVQVNDRQRDHEYVVQDGDRLQVFLPVGGG